MEEKYRKAMVSNAQLDNEKNNLMYQVDTLKDSLMELEELLSETQRGYDEKVKVQQADTSLLNLSIKYKVSSIKYKNSIEKLNGFNLVSQVFFGLINN